MTKTIVARKPMSPFGAALWSHSMTEARRRYSPHAHEHVCVGCGDEYQCNREPDRCEVPSPWLCGFCETEAIDMARRLR